MKVIRWLDENIEKVILVFFSIIMVAVIFLQVVMRQFGGSLSWSEELARYCFIWMIYIGISLGVKEQKHVRIDAILFLLKEKGKMILLFIANLFFMAFAIFVIIYGYEVAHQLLQFGQKSPANQIPMGFIYMATPVGMGLTLIRLIQNQVKLVQSFLGKGKNNNGKEIYF
ncbi:TRAP transporter small permease [Niallia endozanthoxylica]|uniref:TRAP transporter small permease n=1 Tax=Niallia endozanthoxylica TaxID=2036016 RepID=A0A5J5HJD9_9BACI|nr:TRAP transporter small permease [Niallia endozanthoxylica]KAA9019522.1 TRAP transporter small permease [Niallia endozanthoxylica]